MNRKDSPKQSPSYPLTNAYPVILAYWRQQITEGRVTLGKVEAMRELIFAGAEAKGIDTTHAPRKKTVAKTNVTATAQ